MRFTVSALASMKPETVGDGIDPVGGHRQLFSSGAVPGPDFSANTRILLDEVAASHQREY